MQSATDENQTSDWHFSISYGWNFHVNESKDQAQSLHRWYSPFKRSDIRWPPVDTRWNLAPSRRGGHASQCGEEPFLHRSYRIPRFWSQQNRILSTHIKSCSHHEVNASKDSKTSERFPWDCKFLPRITSQIEQHCCNHSPSSPRKIAVSNGRTSNRSHLILQ